MLHLLLVSDVSFSFFFLFPCLNFPASLSFFSFYSLPFLSDAEMKIVGCKFLLFCVMSAYCLLFSIFISFMECWGLVKVINHNIIEKLW